MDSGDENSCALDNLISTCNDISKLSDTLPSISIDEDIDNNNGDHEFFLKEHYDKVDRLRKENFDLKLKLYLLESNEKFTNESELKFKVINEFDKKNEEIKNLKEQLRNQNKVNNEMKKILKKDGKGSNENFYAENQQLKSKLSEALQICSTLVSHTHDLIQRNRRTSEGSMDVEKLNKCVAIIGKATQFLADNSTDSAGNPLYVPNAKSSNEQLDAKKDPALIAQNAVQDENNFELAKNRNNKLSKHEANVNHSSKDAQHKNIEQFMKVVESLRTLIGDFRSNKVTYKSFSTRLDSLFEELDDKYKLLERLQLECRDSEMRLRNAERMLKNEADLKDRIKSDLVKSMKKLDLIISKTKKSVT